MKYAVFIGRFQPFHNAHHAVIKHALGKYDDVIVVIGSAKQAMSPKNPFSWQQRVEMISSCLTEKEKYRVHFVCVRDYLYNEDQWLTDVQRRVADIVQKVPGEVFICGRIKDRSSYYLRLFPQFKVDEFGEQHAFDATMIRKALVEKDLDTISRYTPEKVREYLTTWMHSEHADWVREEANYYEQYQGRFKSIPFPPIHQTADCVVLQAGHILLVRRRNNPGKGLYALPGGFVNQHEPIEQSALRELKEETGILVPKNVLRSRIVDRRTFDHPERSLRGRVITTAYCIRLEPNAEDHDLPGVKGSDDADKAFWMPLVDLPEIEDQFFEDHAHIIRYFTSRG